ncbi:MAG: hypothetical protein WCP70_03600 [Methanothrix sp.]
MENEGYKWLSGLAGGESLTPGAAVHDLDLLPGAGRSCLRPTLRRPYSSFLPSQTSSVLIWKIGWGLSGQKRTGPGMGTGLRADEGDRNGNAGL